MKPVEKFYFAFYKKQSLKLYFNEIKEYSSLGDGSLANVIKLLLEKGFISVEKKRGNTFYIISHLKYAYLNFMKFAMNSYDSLNEDVAYSLFGFNDGMPKDVAFVVMFGSASRGEEIRGKSDIDLMVVLNKFDELKLQNLYEKYIKKKFEYFKDEKNGTSFFPFSLFYTTVDEFETDDDGLIKEVKRTGFPIFGEERFYEIVCKKWRKE